MPGHLRMRISQIRATGISVGKLGEIFLAQDMQEVMVPLA